MLEAATNSGIYGNPTPNAITTVNDELSVTKNLSKDEVLSRIRAGAEDQTEVFYIYYTGGSGAEGNWWMDASSSEQKISCAEIIKTLHDFKYAGKCYIVVDCSMGGRFVYNCQRLFIEEPQLF